MTSVRFLFLFIFFGFLTCPIQAQPDRAALYRDSIRLTSDPMKLMLYYVSLGESVYLTSPDSALHFFEVGTSIAEGIPESKRDTLFYQHYGPLLNNTAFISQKQGDIVRAIELYERSIVAQRASADTTTIGSAYLNLGNLYSEAGEEQLALLNYGLAKETSLLGDPILQAHCQNGIGYIFFVQQNYESALNCYFSALSMFLKADSLTGQTRTHINIGQVYFAQKQLIVAKEFFLKAFNFAIRKEDLQGQAESYYYLGEIALRNDQPDSAQYYGERSLELSKAVGYPRNLRDASSLLFRVYNASGNTSKALEMHILYAQMNDSLKNVEKNNAVIREKLGAEYERKAAEIKAEHEKKTTIAAEEARHQKTVNYFTFAGLFLAITLLIVAYRSYRSKNRAHEIIIAQKKLVDQKNKDITDSIHYAGHLQKALMPHEGVLHKFVKDSFVLFQPKDIVSGDFFWSIASEDYLYIAVCDSTGHGVPGAFVSLLNSSFIKEAVIEKKIISPSKILDFVRERLINSFQDEHSQDGMDGVLIRIDLKDISRSVYAGANNSPVIFREGGVIEFTADKMPVGKSLVASTAFNERPLPLLPGDFLVAFTDGFPDQFGGPNAKKYKYKKLHDFLIKIAGHDGTTQCDLLLAEFIGWKGSSEQTDDVLVCGMKF